MNLKTVVSSAAKDIFFISLCWPAFLPASVVDWHQRRSSSAAKTAPVVRSGSVPQNLLWSCIRTEQTKKKQTNNIYRTTAMKSKEEKTVLNMSTLTGLNQHCEPSVAKAGC